MAFAELTDDGDLVTSKQIDRPQKFPESTRPIILEAIILEAIILEAIILEAIILEAMAMRTIENVVVAAILPAIAVAIYYY